MLPREQPDRISIAFYDPGPVANAGLILSVILTLPQVPVTMVSNGVELIDAPRQAETGLSLVDQRVR